MTLRIRTSLIALALALPAPLLAQTVQDFQLPPNPAPTATPQVEGPVDVESGPVPVRPRAVPQATPTPRIQLPAPARTGQAQPAATPTPAATRPTSVPAGRAPASPPRAQQSSSQPALERPLPAPLPTVAPESSESPVTSLPALPPAAGQTQSAPLGEETDGGGGWLWLLGLLLLGAALAGGIVFWRRRQASLPPPTIERPRVAGSDPVPTALAGQSLSIQATAIRLDRSFLNATLHYRLTLINRAQQALSEVSVGADLVSAHGNAAPEAQLAMPGLALEPRHRIARIAPGQQMAIEGQVQLPLAAANIIRQGSVALLVPLLRLVISGAALAPLARTFVIGQTQAGTTRLQPFRLDDQPQSYQPIAQRALD